MPWNRFLFSLFFTAVLACSASRFACRMTGKIWGKLDNTQVSGVLETPDWMKPENIPGVPHDTAVHRPNRSHWIDPSLKLHARLVEAVKVCAEQAVPWRERLIAFDSWLSETTTEGIRSSVVVSGKNGWLFLQAREHGHCIEDYRGVERFDEETLLETKQVLESLQRVLEDNGIQFCFLVAPNKENVYPEFMPPDIPRLSSLSRIDVMVDVLEKEGKVHTCNAKPALLESKHLCELYYPTDTHWNQAGAYVGVQGVLETLGRMNIPLKERIIEQHPDSELRDLARMAGKTKEDFPNESCCCLPDLEPIPMGWEDNNEWQKYSLHINSDARSGDSMLLVGDSFMMAMVPALLEEFHEVRTIHVELCENLKAMVDDSHPDVIVYEVVERSAGGITGSIRKMVHSFTSIQSSSKE